MRRPEVVVVGGGVIGCAIARRLARDGARTLLVERDEPGAHASWAAAGILSPLAEAAGPGPFLSLLRASRALYPELCAALLAETGIEVRYRDVGTLDLALSEEEEEALEGRLAWLAERGLPAERLSAAELAALEPRLGPSVRCGLRLPEDHQVDNRLLTRALLEAAVRAGAALRTGCEVETVLVEGGRAVGVRLAGGERVEAEAVVVAAGGWAGQLAGLPRPLPVTPIHGQLVAVHTARSPFRHVVHSARVYLVPRIDGRLIIGATMEEVGFERAVTPAGVVGLLGAAIELAPSLADEPLLDWWSGLRPGTPDSLPILGPDPEVAGLHYATGHFRNGILLAPITAELVAGGVRGEPDPELAHFSIARFGDGSPAPAAEGRHTPTTG